MFHCRVCGKPIEAREWHWEECEDCEPFQRAVRQVSEGYREEMPKAALKALEASLNQYDTRTGQSMTDKHAQQLRESMAHTRQHDFYGAFKQPSQVRAAVFSTSATILEMVLKSGLLPYDLTNEIRAFLDEMSAKAKQLTKVLTYQRHDQQWCAFLADQMDEETIGKTAGVRAGLVAGIRAAGGSLVRCAGAHGHGAHLCPA